MFKGAIAQGPPAVPAVNAGVPPVGAQVIARESFSNFISTRWAPNANTTDGSRVWQVQYQIETGVSTDTYTDAVALNGLPVSYSIAFPRGNVNQDTVPMALVAGGTYDLYAGRRVRGRLVHPSASNPRFATGWATSATLAPAWVYENDPANLQALINGGQDDSNPGTKFHNVGWTIGSTVAGYLATGFSNVCLQFLVDRVRNGVTQNRWGFGAALLGPGDQPAAAYPVHAKDGATWDYTIRIRVGVCVSPLEIATIFNTTFNDVGPATTGAWSPELTISVTGSV